MISQSKGASSSRRNTSHTSDFSLWALLICGIKNKTYKLNRSIVDVIGLRFCSIERFSNDCRKTKTKAITPTNHNRSRQRDEPITIPSNNTCNSLEAREKSRVRGAIGFACDSHWLKK